MRGRQSDANSATTYTTSPSSRSERPSCAEHLWTDHSTVPKTADRIAVLAGLTLSPNTEGPVRTRLRQARIGIRHIRFD
jgi:hypothetical protein